ncbi:MAG: ribonuclease III domain-containing protein [Syntrophomonas sp.]|nr:ribonuclease III domain-containing protein [Syntrophomonas sp.]
MHESLDEKTLSQYSPLLLAYVGDAVFELIVRSRLVVAGQRRIRDLHAETVAMVRAENQARLARKLYNHLSEQEQDIVRRGRNTKSTPPKNADMQEYRLSTGFEALIGYVYLKGDQARLAELIKLIDGSD